MSKSQNSSLLRANKVKKDEFYTQLVDIEKELKHYKDQFAGKVVYCNCDDPFESNFFKYFATNFNALRLKKLIATSYVDSKIAGTDLPLLKVIGLKPSDIGPFRIEITKVPDVNKDGVINLTDIEQLLMQEPNASYSLSGDGDFRSEECIELLKEADIVVTNPPFSLFREYVAQLMIYKKKFLILGDQNAITYKDIFSFIKENRLWLGYDNGGTKWFQVPMEYDISTETRKKIVNGVKYFSMGRILWFTNLETAKRHTRLNLYKKYSPKEYPTYDNYDAIEVSRVSDIPADYEGVMGVPLTFIDKYNPMQFEVLGQTHSGDTSPEVESLRKDPLRRHRGILPGSNREKYSRILIRKRKVNDN